MKVETGSRWYVQKTGSGVLGPYTVDEIHRFLSLGRVLSTDRVCPEDGGRLEPLTQVPQLVPEFFLNLQSDWRE